MTILLGPEGRIDIDSVTDTLFRLTIEPRDLLAQTINFQGLTKEEVANAAAAMIRFANGLT